MFKLLYGEFKFNTTTDKILSIFKGLYFIFTIPFLVLANTIEHRTSFKGPAHSKEKVGPIKRVLLHFAAIFWSVFLWAAISNIITDALS